MINRVAHKDLAKRYLAQNGNQSGMAGAEILHSVLNSVTVGAFAGVFLAITIYSWFFGLISGLLSAVLAMLFGAIFSALSQILSGAIVAPFRVGLDRYYFHLRKTGSRTSVTKLFEGYDHFLEFATVEAAKEVAILWLPLVIRVVAVIVCAVIVAISGGIGGALGGAAYGRRNYYGFYGFDSTYGTYMGAAKGVAVGLVIGGLLLIAAFIAAFVLQVYKQLQFWAVDWIQADRPDLKSDQVLNYSKQLTKGHIWELFVYRLSFIGWDALSFITGGIAGIVYVQPYRNMTSALVYEQLKGGAIELQSIPGNSDVHDLTRQIKRTRYDISIEKKPIENTGAQPQPELKGVAGMYAGSRFQLKPDQVVVLGRDSAVAQIVFSQGAEKISRRHCSVVFSSRLQQYQLVDYSSNGTFVAGSRLQPNVPVTLPRGTMVALGSNDNIICLV